MMADIPRSRINYPDSKFLCDTLDHTLKLKYCKNLCYVITVGILMKKRFLRLSQTSFNGIVHCEAFILEEI